jgi:serine/threonine protein kinase
METQKFGRYEIRGEIGRGGMATVYHAYDPRFEREVAIKVLPREMLHDVQFRTRFEREAKTIAMLEHPAIVPVYDFGEEDGQPYFVMRYMTGGSLSERMKKGPISIQDAAHIFTQIAPALDDAHHKGIIHRDLKPGNILFDQFNEPYISDFGIAKLSESQTNVTGSAIVGTPAYMSPEQAQGEGIDGRSDIYGLGVILFEVLTGQQPYHGDTPMSVVVKHITDPVPHILDVKPDLPADIEVIIEKAMAKDRKERFQDVRSMAEALNKVARGESLSLEPFDSTLQASSKTVATAKTTIAAPKRSSQPIQSAVVAPRIQTPTPSEPVLEAPAVSPRRTGLWVGLGAGVLLLCIAGIIGVVLARNKIPFLAAPLPTQTPLVIHGSTTTPLPISSPTTAVISLPKPTDTLASTSLPEPSLTPTVAGLPSIGGADLIAFLSGNDIQLINVDGSNLRQVTKDAAEKHHLQWSPDGQSLFYISGKCIQNATVPDGVISTVACFTAADFLDAFEISPDGSQVAISLNHALYIVPFDLAKLKGASTWIQLRDMKGEFTYTAAATKNVRWSSDGKKLAVDTLSPVSGKLLDLILVFDLSSCSSTAPCTNSIPWLDNFPGSRFTMNSFGTGSGQKTIIPYFDWGSQSLFLLNSIFRFTYGYLYSYNYETKRPAVMIDPMGTTCCYTDARWSPDGSYIFFAYQDITQGANARTRLFYVQGGSLGTGAKYTPLTTSDSILSNPVDHPDPALRPAK